MRTRFLATVLPALALIGPFLHAAEPPEAGELAQQVRHWMQQAKVPGVAVALVRKGKVADIQVFGERAPGIPLTAEAQFNVASLTKPVFAMLVLQMVAEGQWSLDAPLADHWTDPDIAGDDRRLALTPRLALSHQTGLPNWRGSHKLAFLFTPGTRHEYSGEGYEYARRALERKSGKSLNELMHAHLLKKAGMGHTYFGWNPAISGLEVTGFNEAGKPMDMGDLKQREPGAAAHMFTTVGDYARFAAWVIKGAGLPKPLRADMGRPQAKDPNSAEDFGLGWRLVNLGQETALSHDGREGGVRTQVFILPKSEEAVVILTNSNHGELMVRPIVEAALSRGPELMRQVAIDTWRYLLSVPKEQMEPMVQGISRSPSFMSKLLYSVDATLIAQSTAGQAERVKATQAIDPFILGMVQGSVDQATAKQCFALLIEATPSGARLRREFTPAQVAAWTGILKSAEAARIASK